MDFASMSAQILAFKTYAHVGALINELILNENEVGEDSVSQFCNSHKTLHEWHTS